MSFEYVVLHDLASVLYPDSQYHYTLGLDWSAAWAVNCLEMIGLMPTFPIAINVEGICFFNRFISGEFEWWGYRIEDIQNAQCDLPVDVYRSETVMAYRDRKDLVDVEENRSPVVSAEAADGSSAILKTFACRAWTHHWSTYAFPCAPVRITYIFSSKSP